MKKEDFSAFLKQKNADENVEYIQPDYELKTASNDLYFGSQWGLSNNSQVAIGQLPSHDGTSGSADSRGTPSLD